MEKKIYVVIHDFVKDEDNFTVSHEYEDEDEAAENIRLMLRRPELMRNIRMYEAVKLDISELEPMTREEEERMWKEKPER